MGRAAAQSGIAGGRSVAGVTSTLEGFALRRAQRVAIVSEAFRANVEACGVPSDSIQLFPNWSHIEPAIETKEWARTTLGWSLDAFIVAHTGNMGLKQDLGNLVEAARILGDRAEVIFVGDGSQRAHIQKQSARLSNVRFLGSLSPQEYSLALAASDVLVVNERPSVGDMSLPSKLTSYLTAGRPVVAAVSANGATAAEIERTRGAGLVVPPGRPTRLADALLSLKKDPQRRRDMGQRGLAYSQERLGRDVAFNRFEEIIEQAMD
jgi:glycosyltransferase involved in cell wall biosynthesis